MSEPRVSQEKLAYLIEHGLGDGKEAHSVATGALLDLRDTRTRIVALETALAAQQPVIAAARAWRNGSQAWLDAPAGTTKDDRGPSLVALRAAIDALDASGATGGAGR